MKSDVERLLRDFEPGACVRASLDIHFVSTGEVVPEGTLGHVQRKMMHGLYSIAWEGHYANALPTSADSFDPVAEQVG